MLENLDHYRKKLLAAKKQAKQEIRNINEGGLSNSFKDSTSELSSYDNHPADSGTETFERSKDFALRETSRIWLSKIDNALKNIDEGTYGNCAKCHQPIAKERLDVEPETDLCIECRRDSEGHGNPDVRPVEEKVISMPYGGEPGDVLGDADQIEYDGEDTWQDAMQYTEHAERARAGAYYGGADENENIGQVEPVEGIPYFRGADGVIYEDVYGLDDESAPEEVVRGDKGWDKVRPNKKK
ncbi:TraR/DksA C4-type zinc finger protein [Metallumcola ferriviriculae]|uniref:TraR/DksA C4-type zinc finger protein n=1 Tax=Metallumcola ferriviriculae TaxID=3039180 RepID=A0AAU0UNQ1_9FIRM|nr:TraR/DksA C4-type zinc finger protein [Desulfitibacteraceae bacterium MK1]